MSHPPVVFVYFGSSGFMLICTMYTKLAIKFNNNIETKENEGEREKLFLHPMF